MKKFAAVPFICKAKRLARNISNAGIKVKKTTQVSFCKNREVSPDRSHTFGKEYFISVKTICTALLVACGAVIGAYLAAVVYFEAAAFRKSGRR